MVFQIEFSPAITRMKDSIVVNISYLSLRQCPDVCVCFQTLRGKRSAITLLFTFWAFLFLARRSQSDIWLARALGSEPCIFAPIIFGDMAYLHTLKYVAAPTRPTRFPTPIPSTPPWANPSPPKRRKSLKSSHHHSYRNHLHIFNPLRTTTQYLFVITKRFLLFEIAF